MVELKQHNRITLVTTAYSALRHGCVPRQSTSSTKEGSPGSMGDIPQQRDEEEEEEEDRSDV